MQTVVGLFENFESANRALAALQEAGFSDEQVGVLVRDRVIGEQVAVPRSAKRVAGAAGAGALGGGLAGGLLGVLAGLGAVTIPGLGPAFAAGVLSSTLGLAAGGAGVGAGVGGILGAMLGLSIPEEEAQIYAEGVKRGGVLVAVQAGDEQAGRVRTILNRQGALEPQALAESWRQEGWVCFDEDQDPDACPPLRIDSETSN